MADLLAKRRRGRNQTDRGIKLVRGDRDAAEPFETPRDAGFDIQRAKAGESFLQVGARPLRIGASACQPAKEHANPGDLPGIFERTDLRERIFVVRFSAREIAKSERDAPEIAGMQSERPSIVVFSGPLHCSLGKLQRALESPGGNLDIRTMIE